MKLFIANFNNYNECCRPLLKNMKMRIDDIYACISILCRSIKKKHNKKFYFKIIKFTLLEIVYNKYDDIQNILKIKSQAKIVRTFYIF